jgi:flagellar assembly protein FliH
MATVIKAVGPIRTRDGMSFNFDDMTDRANSHLDLVHSQAADILARAQQEGEAIRRKAEADGKQAAVRAVEKVMEEKVGRQLATLVPAIQRTNVELEKARQAWLAHWERAAVHLATRIAERVIRREIARQPQITAQLVREALELATGSDEISVRLNPTDLDALGSHLDSLRQELGGKAKATLIPDETISAGGCRVETRFGVIDQRIEEQLQRIEEELT